MIVRITWLTIGLGLAAIAAEAELSLPADLTTHRDGRAPIEDLYSRCLGLRKAGWELDIITSSQPAGTDDALPIIALRTPRSGPAVWILAGIHGEETAGPNAIAAAIDDIAELGKRHPVVLIPLLNPHGYARNWRYLNMPVYSESTDGQSVGDSSHLLPDPEDVSSPRAPAASSPEADAVTRYIIETLAEYPPRYSIDLHEDDMISAGYVYSQGFLGIDDPLAMEAVRALEENGIPIEVDGQTRFGEQIVGGIIGPVIDSSIDELISAKRIIVDGQVQAGPGARTVLVFETPAGELSLEQRAAAHLALIKRIAGLIH